MKMLHPNGEDNNNVTKIPDGAVNSSVIMERRDEFDLVAPADADEDELWDCIIVDAPFLVGTQIAVRYLTSAAVTVTQLREAVSAAMQSPSVSTAQYPAWLSTNVPGTPAFIFDFTVLSSATLTPTIIGSPTALGGLVKSIRRTYLGSTIDFNAASLTNQGRVVAGQWSPDVTLAISPSTATPPVYSDVYLVQTPAITETEIVQTDELRVAHEAKCGLYFPNRPAATGAAFTSASEMRNLAVHQTGQAPDPVQDPQPFQNDLWLRGWLIGVSHWTGMYHTSSLRIKRNEGIELVASATSVYSPFSTPALANDIRAMQMVQEYSRREPHGYYADYNELGTLLQKILGGVGNAVQSLGLPILSPVGGALSRMANSNIGGRMARAIDAF
jgi:hypothetical protein